MPYINSLCLCLHTVHTFFISSLCMILRYPAALATLSLWPDTCSVASACVCVRVVCARVCHPNHHTCEDLRTSGCKTCMCSGVFSHDYSACRLLPCQNGLILSTSLLLCESRKPANLILQMVFLVTGNYPHGFWLWSEQFSFIVVSSSEVRNLCSFRNEGHTENHAAAVVICCFPVSQGCNLNIFVQGPHCLLITHSAVTCGFSCQLPSLVCSLS